MSNRDIGKETLDGIEEIQRFKKDELKLRSTELSEPSSLEIAEQHPEVFNDIH